LRAFVAGATGYTGREVVRALRERGVDAVGHVRPDSPELPLWRRRFESMGARIDMTPWSDDAMERTMALELPALVFALLGTTRKRAREEKRAGRIASYEAIDYGLTSMLLRAARRAAPSARFIYLSAIDVSGPSRNAYMHARWRMEQELRESGQEFVIARPSFITGPDRVELRPAERIGAAALDSVLALAALVGARRLRSRYRSLSGTQLARALVAAAFDRHATNQILETPELVALGG
jgi:uncharacterized protein YbjT (DUF2867 family)